jgi:hypothetical protein
MTAVLYPVATDAEAALKAPLGRAARERDARDRAGGEVRFTVEETGPAFETLEAALAAHAGLIETGPEDRFCALREVVATVKGRRPALQPAAPAFAEGRRWPAPKPKPRTVWRLSVSYWKLVDAEERAALAQARAARRDPKAEELEPQQLRAMARQPLMPVKPQQPLDIGLFETHPPEAPDTVIPDE